MCMYIKDLSPNDPLSLGKCYLLNFPQLPKVVAPAANQVFKYLSLWGAFTFKS